MRPTPELTQEPTRDSHQRGALLLVACLMDCRMAAPLPALASLDPVTGGIAARQASHRIREAAGQPARTAVRDPGSFRDPGGHVHGAAGVIEFVPTADPMVVQRLRHCEELFAVRSPRLPGGLVETRQTLPQRFREVLQGALP